jgi:hypothetical protein
LYVGIALIGMVLWALINPEKTVDDHERDSDLRADAGP